MIFSYLYSMEIRFTIKEESKKLQEDAFLKLSPAERVINFIELSEQFMQFPTTKPYDTKNNLVLELWKYKK